MLWHIRYFHHTRARGPDNHNFTKLSIFFSQYARLSDFFSKFERWNITEVRGNFKDHLTKFAVLKALPTKSASDVAKKLVEIFGIFGALRILHTDNGREFANQLMKSLLEYWPGCKLVHGKPRHSQSQGSVERANRDLEVQTFSKIGVFQCCKLILKCCFI